MWTVIFFIVLCNVHNVQCLYLLQCSSVYFLVESIAGERRDARSARFSQRSVPPPAAFCVERFTPILSRPISSGY